MPVPAACRTMVSQLIEHGRIETTVQKAKELRRVADQMVTLGKEVRLLLPCLPGGWAGPAPNAIPICRVALLPNSIAGRHACFGRSHPTSGAAAAACRARCTLGDGRRRW